MAEKKFKDTANASALMANTWTFGSFLLMAQGTDASTRVGNKIFVKSVTVSMQMKPQVGMPVSGCTMRFVVYHNKDSLGALPAAVGDLWQTPGIDTLRYTPYLSKYNLLFDQITSGVMTSATTSGPPSIKQITFPINKLIEYKSNLGTIADLLNDDYGYAMICSDASSCNMELRWKVNYTDV